MILGMGACVRVCLRVCVRSLHNHDCCVCLTQYSMVNDLNVTADDERSDSKKNRAAILNDPQDFNGQVEFYIELLHN